VGVLGIPAYRLLTLALALARALMILTTVVWLPVLAAWFTSPCCVVLTWLVFVLEVTDFLFLGGELFFSGFCFFEVFGLLGLTAIIIQVYIKDIFMAYLASTNSVFGARSTTVKPNPVQYCYMQTSDIVQSGNNFLTKKASFILDTACTNVVDDLFLAEAVAASTGVAVANIKIPITGIWILCWTARFLNSSTENGTFFSVQNSKFYNDKQVTGGLPCIQRHRLI
jgi:hypothetical protein